MYKRILLAYNKDAQLALDECISLAKNQKAQVRVAYVLDQVQSFMGMEYIDIEALKVEQRKHGKALLAKAKKYAEKSGLEVEVALLELTTETIAEKINAEAEEYGADLIVLGTKGSSGIKRLLLGSVAEGVIRTATGSASLLLVKEPS
jgi:nucleotide-binding universal stress UspA family protein